MSKKCEHCIELYDEGFVCPDEPHHGEVYWCEECDAEYYREYGGNILATNDEAKLNHPELKVL